MYAIANIIYGIPINDEIHNKANELDVELDETFDVLYSGNAEREVGYAGVHLGSMDEGSDISMNELTKIQPTEEQKQEALVNIAYVDEVLRDLAPEIGIYIVWSTS